jgi:hypothetical protein
VQYLAWFKPDRYIALREAAMKRRPDPVWLKKYIAVYSSLRNQGHPQFAMYATRSVGPVFLLAYLFVLLVAVLFILVRLLR